jgi:hypothetical protein
VTLGALLVYGIYAIIVLVGLFFIRLTLSAKHRMLKFFYASLGFAAFALLAFWIVSAQQKHRSDELAHAGTYYLTKYPNCENCVAVLSKDKTYKVLKGTVVIAKGEWYVESGQDYYIVYLDSGTEQLGSGRFSYQESENDSTIK